MIKRKIVCPNCGECREIFLEDEKLKGIKIINQMTILEKKTSDKMVFSYQENYICYSCNQERYGYRWSSEIKRWTRKIKQG